MTTPVDPDEGLELKPHVVARLRDSLVTPRDELLTREQMDKKDVMLLEGWYVHQAALDAGKRPTAHRLWQVENVTTHLRTLCGQVWLLNQTIPIHGEAALLGRPCRICQRLQHRYAAHDEAK